MPPTRIPLPSDEERAADLARFEREATRRLRILFWGAIARVLMFLAAGLWLIGWSVHTTDLGRGLTAFWGGLLVGNGGLLFTFIRTWLRAQDEGYL